MVSSSLFKTLVALAYLTIAVNSKKTTTSSTTMSIPSQTQSSLPIVENTLEIQPLDEKIVQIFSSVIPERKLGGSLYSCFKDNNDNPEIGCFTLLGAYCHPDYIGKNAVRKQECRTLADNTMSSLNIYWQNFRRYCVPWAWVLKSFPAGDPLSKDCQNAGSDLKLYAKYILSTGPVNVDDRLLNSINQTLIQSSK